MYSLIMLSLIHISILGNMNNHSLGIPFVKMKPKSKLVVHCFFFLNFTSINTDLVSMSRNEVSAKNSYSNLVKMKKTCDLGSPNH